MKAEPSPRLGGRTERNTGAIMRAVLQLLSVKGLQFTYEEVAQLSGVNRRTLHRRWADRMALISDALASSYREFTVPVTGDVAKDVRTLAYRFRDFCDNPIEVAINGLAALSPDASFAQISMRSWMEANSSHAEIFEIPKQKGLINPSLDSRKLLEMLMSPILLSASVLRTRMSDKDLNLLIEHTLRAIACTDEQLKALTGKQ